MNWTMIAGLLRHVLTFGGGYLVARGVIDEGALNEAVAALITLGGVVWSLIEKKQKA